MYEIDWKKSCVQKSGHLNVEHENGISRQHPNITEGKCLQTRTTPLFSASLHSNFKHKKLGFNTA